MMRATSFDLLAKTALVWFCCLKISSAFTILPIVSSIEWNTATRMTATLFSTPPRQPRRNLKKRPRNKRRGEMQPALQTDEQFPWDTAESRPLVSSKSKEAGEDYWIDEEDLQRSIQRREAIKNRKAMEGEIPKEKLWTEVFAPYKQNWIGIFSVMIVILATIVTQFPQLLDQPVIPIPDL